MLPYLNDVFNSIIFSRFIHVVTYICIWFVFLLLNNISSYAYARFDLSLHQLMSIWVVSIFSLLWIMHLWTFMNRFLCKYSFHFSWVNNLEVKLLGCIVTPSLTFGEITRLFNKVVAFQYTFFAISAPGFWFYRILTNTCYIIVVIWWWLLWPSS